MNKDSLSDYLERSTQLSNLFNQIFTYDNLEIAYKQALKEGGRFTTEAIKFQRNETVNLTNLLNSLHDGSYEFSGYMTFKVFEPKVRMINAPYFRDKIVQLCLHNELKYIFVPSFIPESFACIDGRGTHKAVDQVQRNLRQAYWKWGDEAYICKADVRKFFYSIDRDILKELYRRKIKDKDVLEVMDTITDSADSISVKGVPLGNTMSQLYANIYLNQFDNYAKRYLGIKYYVRYMDDIIMILPNKKEAVKAKEQFIYYLDTYLQLEHNVQKTQVFPINQGVNAYGYKVHRTHRLLRNDSKKKLKRKIKKIPKLIAENRLTEDRANLMLGSWTGHAQHANSFNFIHGLLRKHSYLQYDGNILSIDEEEIKCCIEKMDSLN